jgi:uncharacterized protein YjbJ (UPF0337 family)
MEWDRIKEDWKQFKRKAQEKWDKLTDRDLSVINGRRDRLEAKIRQRYGFAPDHVRKEVDDWVRCADLVGPGRSVLFTKRLAKIDAEPGSLHNPAELSGLVIGEFPGLR